VRRRAGWLSLTVHQVLPFSGGARVRIPLKAPPQSRT